MAEFRVPRVVLGASGLEVSRLGLAALSVPAWQPGGPRLDPAEIEGAFHRYGINTFLVHSLMKEICEGVRRLIATGHRDELVLVSESTLPFGGSVRRSLEKQLRVLGTDHLDVWLEGWVRSRWYVRAPVWSEMLRARDTGQARAIGFSCHDRPLAASLARELRADILMIRYNAAHRGAEREIFAPLEQAGADRPGIIAYTATRWGMLLRPLPDRGFPAGMTGPECYRFVLEHPTVDMVWSAPRTAAELRENAEGILAGPLPDARREEVRRFGDAVHSAARGGFKWMFGSTSH